MKLWCFQNWKKSEPQTTIITADKGLAPLPSILCNNWPTDGSNSKDDPKPKKDRKLGFAAQLKAAVVGPSRFLVHLQFNPTLHCLPMHLY